MNPIFLIVGAPATGKSTASKALAARFSKSLHISVDDLRMMVVSGLALPGAEWSDALVEQLHLARISAAQMALTYRQAGFMVVIDDFWDAALPTDYGALWSEPAFHRVVLHPSQAQAHAQNLKRAGDSPARPYIDEGIKLVYAQLTPVIPDLPGAGWHVIDSTGMSVDSLTDTILGRTIG